MVLLTWIRISTLPCVIHFAAISLYGTYKTDNFMFIYHEKRPFVLASFVVFYVVFFFQKVVLKNACLDLMTAKIKTLKFKMKRNHPLSKIFQFEWLYSLYVSGTVLSPMAIKMHEIMSSSMYTFCRSISD